jgi:cytochrome c oxidase assembly protein subunit 15
MTGFFIRLTQGSLLIAVMMSLLSAYIRLADSGIDCKPWPDCFASSFHFDQAPGITIGDEDSFKVLRATHRLMASTFGILSLLMVIMSWWYRPQIATRTIPLLVLVLTLILTFVGMRTPDLATPAVMLTNLVGGMCLSALLVWQLSRINSTGSVNGTAALAWCTLLLTIASGAWVSANFANAACISLPQCEISVTVGAFDPGRALTIRDNAIQFDDAQPAILAAHYVLGTLLLLGFITYGIRLLTDNRHHGTVLIALTVLLILVIIVEYFYRSANLAAMHNLFSLALLLWVSNLCYRKETPGRLP